MLRPLDNVVVWKQRVTPGNRIIPPYLKLAILSRGRIALPPQNIKWMLDEAVQRGETWPTRLTADLATLFPEVPVTIELFLNQWPTMTVDEINQTLAAYLSLRHQRHLPGCFLLRFSWGTHGKRHILERNLDVDFRRLYARARVWPPREDTSRYILVVYVCLPPELARFIAPERQPLPGPPPMPAQHKPPLDGRTSRNTEFHLRDAPTTSAKSLGEQMGHYIPVRVLDKAEWDKAEAEEAFPEKSSFLFGKRETLRDKVWFQVELLEELRVEQNGKPGTLAAGTRAWITESGIEMCAAPWEFFRHQLIELEGQNKKLPLSRRITRLRQMSHSRNTPFDAVLETSKGNVYKDSLPFIADRWQLFRDYAQTRAPDGRLVDIHHLLVGLDVLQRPETPARFLGIPIGTNYAASTWSGDLGSGAAEMTLTFDKFWEKRDKRTPAERAEYYFSTRAPEWDLLADIDAWGIHALREPDVDTIDALLALYYEETREGGRRTLTTARRDALERFLSHYGFSYEIAKDLTNYPVFPKQHEAVGRISRAILAFGHVWLVGRQPMRLTSRDEKVQYPKGEDIAAMTAKFLFWLEDQAIENGAEIPYPNP